MIIDAFIFFNELDILEARLSYLYNTVDYFVIVESNITFSGEPKPFYYLENQERFKKYKDKIIWNPYIFNHTDKSQEFSKSITSINYDALEWKVEFNQRDHIAECIKMFDDNAVVMISDLDEIPKIESIKYCVTNKIDVAVFFQHFFYYDCTNLHINPWHGTVITTNRIIQQSPIRDLRLLRHTMPKLYDSGWHLSYFGGVDQIIKKISSFSHQELNNEYYKNPERIASVIDQGVDLFNRPQDQFRKAPPDIFTSEFVLAFYQYMPMDVLNSVMSNISAWTGHRAFAEWLVDTLSPSVVVDLGVDCGFSTYSFGMDKKTKVYGIDSFEGDIQTGFRDAFKFVNTIKTHYQYDNITFIKGMFDDVASTWDKNIDILHIDGLHTYEAVKHDYETWKDFLNDDAVILFHDTESYANTVGRFFNELNLHKINFTNSAGLGVASKNKAIIDNIANKCNPIKMPSLNVFVHLTDLPDGKSITDEQIDLMIASDLINNCTLHLICNYSVDYYDWLKIKLSAYTNVHFIHTDALPQEFEIPTLIELKTVCDNLDEEQYVLYIHQKGITRPTSLPVKDWRDFINHFNITKWRDNVAMLGQGYDVSGVDWNSDFQYPHYAGNVWWAKSSYIKTLPILKKPRENNFITQLNRAQDFHRQDCEFWIGMASPNAYSLHNSYTNHYSHRYQPFMYREDYAPVPIIAGAFNWEDKAFYSEMVDRIQQSGVFLELNPGAGQSTALLMELSATKKINISIDVITNARDIIDFNNSALPISGIYNPMIDYTGIDNNFDNNSIDFIFIHRPSDGKTLSEEIARWLPKITKDGIIAGYDFFNSDVAKIVSDNFTQFDVLGRCWYAKV